MNSAFVISGAEATLFWVAAPIMVLLALALLVAKRTLHIAVAVAGVMVGLAVLYIANEAPFLGIVQIVVYTGAVMMLFLFVIMLAGVDATESFTENIKSQRFLTVVAGVGSIAFFIALFTRANLPEPVGLSGANVDTNPVGVARIIFSDYVFSFGMVAALLITAALGALILTHRVELDKKLGQRENVEVKMAALGAGDQSGIAPRPNPGVYAQHNAADIPSLDPAGNPITESVSGILRVRSIGDTELARTVAELTGHDDAHVDPSEGVDQKEIEA